MASEVRQTVDDIFHIASALAPDDREVYLNKACEGNRQLKLEIEDLLKHYSKDDDFLEKPALHDAAGMFYREKPLDDTLSDSLPGSGAESLQTGEWSIGPYRIISPIGKGGMGIVYLAEDTRNGQQVAIKVLQRDFVFDEDRRARFSREARMLEELKHLKHPNIAEIYEQTEYDGKPCLVLEYVPGETLADKLERGSLSVNETLQISSQLAGALATAHRQRIVHRDLKPANIKITPDGYVKVLDFGLAKRFYPDDAVASEYHIRSLSLTESGMLIGTPAFMSPEQWNGQDTDQRTDIWAFGCLLFEMLSGKAPFIRKTRAETMKAALEDQPDWSALNQNTPIVIQDLLRKCLQKDSSSRLQDAGEAQSIIDKAIAENKFALWLLLKSWGWKIDRRTVIALVSVALVLAFGLAWRYTPLPNLFKRAEVLELSRRDDLTTILPERLKKANVDINGELVGAVLMPGKQSSEDQLTGEKIKSLRENVVYLEKISEIIASLNDALRKDPQNAQLLAILSQAYLFRSYITLDKGDSEKAVDAARKADKLNPSLIDVQIAIGNVLTSAGLHDEATNTFQRALDNPVSPNNPEVLLGLAYAYEHTDSSTGKSDKYDKARKYYDEAIKRRLEVEGKEYSGDYNERASFFSAQGQYELAEADWKKAASLDSTNPSILSNLGTVYLNQGCLDGALASFTASIGLKGTEDAFANRGAVYFYKGDYVSAINDLERVTRKSTGAAEDSNQPYSWFNLGDAYAKAGRNNDAIAAYNQSLSLISSYLSNHPGDHLIISLKAEVIAKLNALDQSVTREDPIRLIETTLKSDDQCQECMESAVIVYQLSAKTREAILWARKAAEDSSGALVVKHTPELAGLLQDRELQNIIAKHRPKCGG